jgi:hypothetical protein
MSVQHGILEGQNVTFTCPLYEHPPGISLIIVVSSGYVVGKKPIILNFSQINVPGGLQFSTTIIAMVDI